jgi:multisubunit Na+/H+ antiporter MnhE subunit
MCYLFGHWTQQAGSQMLGVKRREFITLLGGADRVAAAGTCAAPSKVARVLLFSTPQADPQMKAIHIRLREPGHDVILALMIG